MAEPFLGQIAIVGFDYAPEGWAFCDGQKMAISQQQSLYALIGNTFGGDGKTYFNLPDLRGKVPVGTGGSYRLGNTGGSEQVGLTGEGLPPHTHKFCGIDAPGTKNGPGKKKDALLANEDNKDFFASEPTELVSLQPDSVSMAGKGDPHNNIQPSLGLNFIIALTGMFPS
ncbi:MAG: tail fiber protein [Victivallaceae bacterium]|nr:tail fiber protein [Victivallaceae bacterium]